MVPKLASETLRTIRQSSMNAEGFGAQDATFGCFDCLCNHSAANTLCWAQQIVQYTNTLTQRTPKLKAMLDFCSRISSLELLEFGTAVISAVLSQTNNLCVPKCYQPGFLQPFGTSMSVYAPLKLDEQQRTNSMRSYVEN